MIKPLLVWLASNWKLVLAFAGGWFVSNFLQSITKPQQGDVSQVLMSIMTPMISMMSTMMFIMMFMKMFDKLIEEIGESL